MPSSVSLDVEATTLQCVINEDKKKRADTAQASQIDKAKFCNQSPAITAGDANKNFYLRLPDFGLKE